MSIYKTSINKPVTTALIFVAVAIIGLFSLSRLPIDQFPEMEPPYITVMTTYPGASASEIETNVTKIVENSLNSVDGLKEISSQSKDHMSMVMLEMEWGTNLDEVMNDIRSYVDMLKDQLPDGCSNPFIFKFSSSSMPIIQFAITAGDSYAGLDKLLNDEVIPQLNRVNGIGNISLSGAPERYVYVNLDQAKLDAYGIPLETVGNMISANNLNLSSGTVKMNKEQYQMQVRSEFLESSEIEGIVVTTTPTGQQVFVRDIAQVKDTIKDLSLDEKINSRDGVRMMITKQTGANTVQICNAVNKELKRIEKTLPSDVKIDVIYDSSEEIQNSINSLAESIFYALLFVVLVVLLFLGRWRATFIIGITIPIALIVAFIYLMLVDSSLNIISMSSLSIAIGMVVDDAIVVLENITTHIERGSRPKQAAIHATNEVAISVVASTLTMLAVFMPMTMISGLSGVLFRQLGWIVSIIMIVSTIGALTFIPMLCSQWLRQNPTKGKFQQAIFGPITKFLDWLDIAYGKLLNWCVRNRRKTILISLLLFLLVVVGGGKMVKTEFFPMSDNGRISVTVELPMGTRQEITRELALELVERFTTKYPVIRTCNVSLGASNSNSSTFEMMQTSGTHYMSFNINLGSVEDREIGLLEV